MLNNLCTLLARVSSNHFHNHRVTRNSEMETSSSCKWLMTKFASLIWAGLFCHQVWFSAVYGALHIYNDLNNDAKVLKGYIMSQTCQVQLCVLWVLWRDFSSTESLPYGKIVNVCIEDPFLVVSSKRGNTALAQSCNIYRGYYMSTFLTNTHLHSPCAISIVQSPSGAKPGAPRGP